MTRMHSWTAYGPLDVGVERGGNNRRDLLSPLVNSQLCESHLMIELFGS